MRSAIAAWQWIYDYLRSFLVASMVIGFVASFWRMEGFRWTFGAIIAAYLGNMFLYSIASDGQHRDVRLRCRARHLFHDMLACSCANFVHGQKSGHHRHPYRRAHCDGR